MNPSCESDDLVLSSALHSDTIEDDSYPFYGQLLYEV